MSASVLNVAETGWSVPPAGPLSHLRTYSRFTWQRNWLRLLVWALVIVGLVGFVAAYYMRLFGHDDTALKEFGDLAAQPPLNALVGTISNPYVLGGALWCKSWMFAALMLQIGMLYLTTRNLRGDEDAGRAELMRAYPLGLHARLAATVWISCLACLVIGLVSGPIIAVTFAPSPYDGSSAGAYVFGLSVATMGILGVGIGALTNQLASSNGAANGLGVGIIAVFYVLRMLGDMNGTPALIWASPIGWGQKADPWGADRVWPLVLQVVLAAVCVAIAWVIEQRRDLGAGLIAQRAGSSRASRLTRTALGLGLRTQRASLIAWLVVVIITGDLLGGVVQKMADLIASTPEAFVLAGSGGAVLDGTVALMGGIMALAISAFSIQSVSTLRADEEAGLAEAQLAGSVSRIGWALRRLAIALVATVLLLVIAGGVMGAAYVQAGGDASWTTTCVQAVLIYLPAVALLMSVVVLGLGWWPRQAVAVSWIVLGAMFAVMIVGVALNIPQRVLNLMPFQALPAIPADPFRWTPVLVESGLAIALTVVGLVGLRRRVVPTL